MTLEFLFAGPVVVYLGNYRLEMQNLLTFLEMLVA